MDEFRLVSGEVRLTASSSEYGHLPWDLQDEKAAVNSSGSFPGVQKQKIYQESAELMNHLDFVVSWLMQLLTIDWQLDACHLVNSATTVIPLLQQMCPRPHTYTFLVMLKSPLPSHPTPSPCCLTATWPFMFIRPCQRWAAHAVQIQGTVKFK